MEATNELGDVYAHFGSWKEAVQAWNDALDCIIGPYQVTCSASRHVASLLRSDVIRSSLMDSHTNAVPPCVLSPSVKMCLELSVQSRNMMCSMTWLDTLCRSSSSGAAT